ncbi:HK97 gp10 family phage protein [Lactococcus lactis]|uniref:HK97-gp10 family putative phage morphogenesis protein n=1 Tax=Lactococcus lactis TaxID=1358 RepID=UPI00280AB492|nr:HK97-gp10 family putative phage morphogenesis protein [Lactococcus lactis]WMM20165.1 HK97 gp10 family phage protein [Lactococcus lactis]WMM21929.1 HK97 gp10 family phage protein [Lactococcus lactis]
MADYEISINGANELEKLLEDTRGLEEVKEIVKRNGANMLRYSQRKVPVDTSFLKRSAIMRIFDGGLAVSVSYNTDYAAYQEYGTRFIAGKFYLEQAFNIVSLNFTSELERLFK